MKQIVILLMALIVISCNPLRRTQRTQKIDSTTVNNSQIQKMVAEAVRQHGSFSQTIVEYYPAPQREKPDNSDSDNPSPDVAPVITDPPDIKPPPVKRIIRTEIATSSDSQKTTDSIANMNLRTGVASELSDKVVEKPPSSVISLRWAVVGIVSILLLFLIVKFRYKFK